MNEARTALLARRAALIVRIDDQRRALARREHILEQPLLGVEIAVRTWRLFTRYPTWLGAAALAVAITRQGSAAPLVCRGWIVWQGVRGVWQAWRTLVACTQAEVDANHRTGDTDAAP
ncbi:MAG: hypothetical protein H6977_20700 [Gammaproteobacteria bacterium]|nr:hypothetical protein [Gammaproteobacteria bacterium]